MIMPALDVHPGRITFAAAFPMKVGRFALTQSHEIQRQFQISAVTPGSSMHVVPLRTAYRSAGDKR